MAQKLDGSELDVTGKGMKKVGINVAAKIEHYGKQTNKQKSTMLLNSVMVCKKMFACLCSLYCSQIRFASLHQVVL